MNVIYLNNNEIDRQKWDDCIHRAYNRNTYAFSWYLDAVCEHWDALITNDYQVVFPIPFKKKYGLKVVYQPFFVQQLGIFSQAPLSREEQIEILQSIPKKFKLGRLQLNRFNDVDEQLFKTSNRINYELLLNVDYGTIFANYSKNAKRNLQKAYKAGLQIKKGEEIANVVFMFQKFKSPTLKNFPKNVFQKLESLFEALKKRDGVMICDAYTSDNELCASVILVKDDTRLIYLFSGCTPVAYKNGAQFFLVDFIIQKFANKQLILDFEGSNDPNLARFYKGFGAYKTSYPVLFFEKFPKIFVKLLQWMRKI